MTRIPLHRQRPLFTQEYKQEYENTTPKSCFTETLAILYEQEVERDCWVVQVRWEVISGVRNAMSLYIHESLLNNENMLNTAIDSLVEQVIYAVLQEEARL